MVATFVASLVALYQDVRKREAISEYNDEFITVDAYSKRNLEATAVVKQPPPLIPLRKMTTA